MPRGHAPKRETKKPKKKPDKAAGIAPPIVASTEVEVIRRKRKKLQEDEL